MTPGKFAKGSEERAITERAIRRPDSADVRDMLTAIDARDERIRGLERENADLHQRLVEIRKRCDQTVGMLKVAREALKP